MPSRSKDNNKRMSNAQSIREDEQRAREARRRQLEALKEKSSMAAIEMEAAKATEEVKPDDAPVSQPVQPDTTRSDKPQEAHENVSDKKPEEHKNIVVEPTSTAFTAMNEPVADNAEKEKQVQPEKPKTKGKKTGYVKSAKRRVEKTVSDVKTIKKESVPEESKNYAYTQSFSVDEDTMNHLEAVVELLQKSGLTIDDRLITISSFARRAVQRELQATYEANGPEFKDAVESLIHSKDIPLSFKLG